MNNVLYLAVFLVNGWGSSAFIIGVLIPLIVSPRGILPPHLIPRIPFIVLGDVAITIASIIKYPVVALL